MAKIHGSDLEYAVRLQDRYRELAREGLQPARAIVGPTNDVLRRCSELVPGIQPLLRVVPPGVEVAAFHPRPRAEALEEAARLLEADRDSARGRPSELDGEVEAALVARDAEALDALADTYDQAVPEPDAAARLRALARGDGPIVGYLGKLIPQKGVELLLAAHRGARHDAHALVVPLRDEHRTARDVVFTGRLDHRYAPDALAAMDVQVVPSILEEAFGMVAAEGAAAGALPLVARHSGLGEVGAALETEIGRPGLLSFEPGERAIATLGEGIDRLLELPAAERDDLRRAVSAFVSREWTWDRTTAGMLAAAGVT